MTRITVIAISAALAMALTAGFANSQEQPADEGTPEATAPLKKSRTRPSPSSLRGKTSRHEKSCKKIERNTGPPPSFRRPGRCWRSRKAPTTIKSKSTRESRA